MRNKLFVDVRVSSGSGREGGTLQEMGPMGSPCSFDPDSEIQLICLQKSGISFLPTKNACSDFPGLFILEWLFLMPHSP